MTNYRILGKLFSLVSFSLALTGLGDFAARTLSAAVVSNAAFSRCPSPSDCDTDAFTDGKETTRKAEPVSTKNSPSHVSGNGAVSETERHSCRSQLFDGILANFPTIYCLISPKIVLAASAAGYFK